MKYRLLLLKQRASCPFPVIFKSLGDRKLKKVFFPRVFFFPLFPRAPTTKKKETKGVSGRPDLKTNGSTDYFYERVRWTWYVTKRYIFRSFPHSWVKLAHHVHCIFCFIKALLVKSKESSNKICIKYFIISLPGQLEQAWGKFSKCFTNFSTHDVVLTLMRFRKFEFLA